jgi:hypothetical protein
MVLMLQKSFESLFTVQGGVGHGTNTEYHSSMHGYAQWTRGVTENARLVTVVDYMHVMK